MVRGVRQHPSARPPSWIPPIAAAQTVDHPASLRVVPCRTRELASDGLARAHIRRRPSRTRWRNARFGSPLCRIARVAAALSIARAPSRASSAGSLSSLPMRGRYAVTASGKSPLGGNRNSGGMVGLSSPGMNRCCPTYSSGGSRMSGSPVSAWRRTRAPCVASAATRSFPAPHPSERVNTGLIVGKHHGCGNALRASPPLCQSRQINLLSRQ
jgi:hypothetical protein